MAADLRSFLRRTPKPFRIRATAANGDERLIPTNDNRTRWHTIETTIKNAHAVLVECLDKTDQVIRSLQLEDEETDESGDPYEAKRKSDDAMLSRDRGQMAAMFDAYGRRIKEAYDAGAAAASQSQDKLVVLVETLTENLTAAIVNLHNIAVSNAESVQLHARQIALLTAGQGEEGQSGAAMMQMLGAAMGIRPPGGPQAGVNVNIDTNGSASTKGGKK